MSSKDSNGGEDLRICDPGGGGLLLPTGRAEQEWDNPKVKVVIYGMGLCYCFLGVSIVADTFMSAIERITSNTRCVRIPGTKHHRTVVVWNDTVANLTLMALGSSAPEILLSLNDVFKNKFFEGKLGPSTIVGSAAFNLFVIIAVCINSVPYGEVRQIKETRVFFITGIFSILAYVWLLYIVQFNSKDIIEAWEGVATFCFFPLLVGISYAADVGWLFRKSKKPSGSDLEGGQPTFSADASSVGYGGQLPSAGCCGRLLGHKCVGAMRMLCIGQHRPHELEEEVATVDDGPLVGWDGETLVNEAGFITFESDVLEVGSGRDRWECTIPVIRKNGSDGRVSCKYRTQALTAAPSYDYEETSGELNFRGGATAEKITITILPKDIGEHADQFQVILEETTGGLRCNPMSDGGDEKCLLTVTIRNENPGHGIRSRMIGCLDWALNLDEMRLGSEEWWDQVVEAVHVNGGEDGGEASFTDWLQHIIWLPWKILFACLTPPTRYCGGWICFWVSLIHIAWITVVIGDLAELFGCEADIQDSVTAITFVALGTSMPDLFASRAAAKQDEYADASIVNVTGSNSVNVFLGIGLPWMLAAFYWEMGTPTVVWEERYPSLAQKLAPNAAFIVKSGDLAFSVAVFTIAAFVCLALITVRRMAFDGELGGPEDAKAYSSATLMLLWIFYIGLSIWKYNSGEVAFTTQVAAIAIAIPCFIILLLAFGVMRKLLVLSKKYINEDTFWGVLVAALVLGGRALYFFVFQLEW